MIKDLVKNVVTALALALVVISGFKFNDYLDQRAYRKAAVYRADKLDPIDYGSVPAEETLMSIVRLSSNDKGFCSGVVISKNYALTAGHCLVGQLDIFGNGKKIQVNGLNKSDNEYNDQAVTGQVVVYFMYSGVDLGLVKGDFSKFEKVKADFNMPRQIKVPANPLEALMMQLAGVSPTMVLSCGFPGGNKHAICAQIPVTQPDGFGTVGKGNIIPGMSGGPVLDSQGVLVGINRAQSLQGSAAYFSNLTGALGFLGLE